MLLSLRVLLTLPPPTNNQLRDVHKQVANGVADLVNSHAPTIKSPHDWSIIFTMLEYAGSGISNYDVSETMPLGGVAMETSEGVEPAQEVEVTSLPLGETPNTNETVESHDGIKESDWSNMSAEIRANWVWVSSTEPIQKPVNASLNSFDLLIQATIPVHEPQVWYNQ